MKYTNGRFSAVSAVLTLGLTKDETAQLTVAEGDELTDLVIAAGNYGTVKEQTIPSCTVVGFTMRNIDVPRGAVRSYDGVPMYMADPNGNGYRGTVEEIVEVRDLIVELPPVDEGEDRETIRVLVDNIISINGTPAEEETNDDNG